MVALPMHHDLGRIDRISIDDIPALSRDVALDLLLGATPCEHGGGLGRHQG